MDDRPNVLPNVLIVTCDQWRGDALSAVGHPIVRTPNVDRLAEDGTLFASHFASAAPCSPARACIYTGLYQMNNRVCGNGTPLDRRFDNIALAARRGGYTPTLFGYTDTSPDPRGLDPSDPALRTYEGVLPGFIVRQLLLEHQKPWLSWLATRGVDATPGFPNIHRPASGAPAVSADPPVYGRDETPSAFLAGEFIRWLGEQDAGDPWFAHVSFLSPHPPFIAPEPYNRMYDPTDGPAFRRASDSETEAAIHPLVAWGLDRLQRKSFLPGATGKVRDWSDDEFRAIRAIYWGMISDVDAQLGRIRSAIEARGDWDNTIIVVMSDHAEMMGDHWALGKGGFFDQSYHVPLVIRDPGRSGGRGRKVAAFTEAVDIMPTLLDLIGIAPANRVDGRSLAPFLDGLTPASWRTEAHWEYDFRSLTDGSAEAAFGLTSTQCNLSVLRGERFKYVHVNGGLPPLLFDLAADPGETRNLAGDDAYLRVRLDCAERLLAWRAEHLDQTLALMQLTDEGLRIAPERA